MLAADVGQPFVLHGDDLLSEVAVNPIPVGIDAQGRHVDALLVHSLETHRQLGIDVEVRAQGWPRKLEVSEGKGLRHRTMRVDIRGPDALAVDDDFAPARLRLRGGGDAQLTVREYEAGNGASGRVQKVPTGGHAAGSSPGGLIGVTTAGGCCASRASDRISSPAPACVGHEPDGTTTG